MGVLFLWKGKIKTTVFCRIEGTLTVKKRNLFCDKRTITTYKLKHISDVRAVHRGFNSGGSNTERFFIIIEFEAHRNDTLDEEDSFSSSDDEFHYLKEKLRLQEEATEHSNSEK